MTSPSVPMKFDNTYARLPERFYARVNPTTVSAPTLIQLNVGLALELGLDPDQLARPEGVAALAGNSIFEGSEPIALAYAGHQFGHFVPQLGDGRANLLGEVVDRHGKRFDIQLKGSGPTPFSRRGDGRAALGPVLREYLVSEAMAAMSVPTTRALAALITGDRVFRETLLPGAILTRVAASHLRVGTFQYFAAQGDVEAVTILARYAMERHYPEALQSPQPTLAFLNGVIARQARLVAQWMLLGFVHGVMNTDNTSISGETIDYGPCAFLEAYDPAMTFSSIDERGRYSYSNQPYAMQWNLSRLAETLLPLLTHETGSEEAALAAARSSLESFMPQFETARLDGFRRKLGLMDQLEGDAEIVQDLLTRMAAQKADFTLTFHGLIAAASQRDGAVEDGGVRERFSDPTAYDAWHKTWRSRLARESSSEEDRAATLRTANPHYIARNHLVEAAIEAATNRQNFQPFEHLLKVVTSPFADMVEFEDFAAPALAEELIHQTFCGT
jgi:uncharacterized protein YdiU (UPF0061 family)